MDAVHPRSSHWPLEVATVQSFLAMMRAPATASRYLGAVRFGARMVGVDDLAHCSALSAVQRGLTAVHPRRPMPVLRDCHVRPMVAQAVRQGEVELARVFAVARLFMLRVQSELASLTVGPHPAASPPHPSFATVSAGRVELWLARRKCAPRGSLLSRACVCQRYGRLLCGACAVAAQVRARRAAGAAPSDPLFPAFDATRCRPLLARLAKEAGVDAVGWHAFRRGMAADLVKAGTPLAQVLTSGGWKSSAFLRYVLRHEAEEVAACGLERDESESE